LGTCEEHADTLLASCSSPAVSSERAEHAGHVPCVHNHDIIICRTILLLDYVMSRDGFSKILVSTLNDSTKYAIRTLVDAIGNPLMG
jgi:hypothetical protein